MAKEENAPQVVGMPPELLALLLERLNQPSTGGMTAEQLAEILHATGLSTANAMQKALKPENAFHPGVSVYSYPEGDRDRPRPALRCAMSWVGHPIDSGNEGNEHWYELELLNQMEPGAYTVHKTDQSEVQLTVTGIKAPDGTLERMDFTFPVGGMEKYNVAPKPVMLLEALGMTYMEAMTKYLQVQIEDVKAKTRPAVAA
jgi:hypothetical protein